MNKVLIFLAMVLILAGCSGKERETGNTQSGTGTQSDTAERKKYTTTFYERFDTQIQYLEYSTSKEEFEKNSKFVEDEYTRLHKLYDNYHTYEGINNVMTINNNAGKEPVVVDDDLFNLIKFAVDNYDKTLGYTNIAYGSVLEIWHNIREKNEGLEDSKTQLPSESDLKEASKHTNIKNIVLDEKKKTVFIKDSSTKIDLGSVAKGYATELIAKKLESMNIKNASINAGGNVRTIGKPGDGRNTWAIALQNPDLTSSEYLDVLHIEGSKSIVTSGDYQRFFKHKGKIYHHIINPFTMWPEIKYHSVTIVTKDSGLADMLSTALFLANKEEAEKILKNYKDEIGVIWADDKGMTNTENMEKMMASKGAKKR